MTYDQWKTRNPDDENLGPPPAFICSRCREKCDPDECESTWQQWQCPGCGSWEQLPPRY